MSLTPDAPLGVVMPVPEYASSLHMSNAQRLASKWLRVPLARLLQTCGAVWVQTLGYELRSFGYRIRAIHRKELTCHLVKKARACQSCESRKTPWRCRNVHDGMRHIELLVNRYPWLSYGDMNLLVEGFDAAVQSTPRSLACGIWLELLGEDSSEPHGINCLYTTCTSTLIHKSFGGLPTVKG